MKITGYKIKEMLKLVERLQDDFPLTGIYLPKEVDDETGGFYYAQILSSNFETHQILSEDISRLKLIQLKYNSLVKVGDNMSLAEVIQTTSKISGLATKLEGVLREVQTAEVGVKMNREHCEPSQMYPHGRQPRFSVPCIQANDLKSALRKFRAEETRMKNLIGYGNSVEVEMLNEHEELHYLFDEARLQKFNLVTEKARIASAKLGVNSVSVEDTFVFLDPKFIEKALRDLPETSRESPAEKAPDLNKSSNP
jgi:hypothetical protein